MKKRVFNTVYLIIVTILIGLMLEIVYLLLRIPYGSRVEKEVAVSLQATGYTCGAASLKMVLSAFNIEVEEDEIAFLAGTEPKMGTTMAGLQKAAEALGLEMVGMKLSPLLLKLVNKPLIAYLGRHNVVVLGIVGNNIHIADPARGEVWFTMEDFMKLWQGYALVPNKRREVGRRN